MDGARQSPAVSDGCPIAHRTRLTDQPSLLCYIDIPGPLDFNSHRPSMEYSSKRTPGGGQRRIGLRIAIIAAAAGVVIVMVVFAISNWLGPFPFGISHRDTTLLTLWNEGRYEQVLTEAELVLEERPLDTQALTLGGFAHFYVGVDLAAADERRSHIEQAIVLLRKAEHLPRAPLPGERSYVLAKAYYHKGESYFDISAEYMERALEQGFAAEDAHAYLGLAYEGMGDFGQSAAWYDAGIGAGDSAAMRIKAAESYVSLGDYIAAEGHLRTALEATSDAFLDLVLRNQLGWVLILQNRLSEAEALLLAVVEEHPDSADAVYYLGVVYQRTGRPVEARSMWRRAREIDPDHLEALQSLANRED